MAVRGKRKIPTWAVIVGTLGLVCLCAWGVLQLPAVRARIRVELRGAIRRELGLNASIESVSVGLPFVLQGEQVKLEHPQHGLLASARVLEITPSVMWLLRGQLRLRRVLIEAAHVRLRVEEGRIVNLPTLTEKKPEPDVAERRLPLRELLVQDASLEVDALPSYRAALERVNIAVGVQRGKLLDLSAVAGGGYLVSDGAREELRKLVVSGRVDPERIQVDSLELDTSVVKLGITRGFVPLPLDAGPYGGSIRFETDLAKLARLPLGVALPVVEGSVKLALQLEGKGSDFHITGSLHGDNPKLEGFGFGELDLKLDATPREVKLLPGSQGRFVENGGVVMLTGKVGLTPSVPLEVSADIKHIEFHKLMKQLGVTDNCIVNWVMRGGFKLSGTANPLDVTGPIWTDTLHFRALTSAWHDPAAREVIGTPPGRVTGRVVVRPDALRFENLRARLPNSEMNVLVHVGFTDKIIVSARSDKLDLADTTGLMGMPLAGKGGFSLDVGGTYSNTTLTGSLDLQEFMIDAYRLGHLRTHAVLEKEGVAVRFLDSDIRKNESHYVIDDMLLDFSHGFVIDARARFERLALADFYHSLELDKDPDFTPYQGHVRGAAEVRYTLDTPGDGPDGTLRVAARLDVTDAHVHGVAFDGGRIDGDWLWPEIAQGTRGAKLDLRELRLTRGAGQLIARGKMDLGAALRLTVFAERMSLGALEPLANSSIDLAGEAGLSGTVRGTPWLPEARLDLNLAGVRVNKRGLGDGNLNLYVTHRDDSWLTRAHAADLDTSTADPPCALARAAMREATWGSEPLPGQPQAPPRAVLLCGRAFADRLTFDVALGVDPKLPLRGRVAFSDVPPAWLLPDNAQREALMLGAVAGNVHVTSGSALDPDSLVGGVSLDSLRLGQDGSWLASDGPIQIALTGRGALVRRARFTGQGTSLVLRGGASLRRGLTLELAGRFNLAVLPSLVPAISQATGDLDLSMKVSGEPSNPGVFGRAKLSSGSLMLASYPLPLDKLSAQLRFSEHEILLDELTGTLAGGQVSAHGSAALKGRGVESYELFASARDLFTEPMPGVEIALSAETKLQGGKGMRIPELTGTVRILRATYKRPFSLGIAERLSGFSQAKRVVRDTYDPGKDHIAFDLRILDEGPIRVQNNLLTAELSVEDSERAFRIVGTDQRTGVLGTLTLTRGTMVFRNAQFLIESGTVTFLDETRVRPRLDIQARTEFRRTADASGLRWLISLHAYGEADNLKLDTTSDPSLAREDIALLLTVGLTRAEAERLGTTALTQGAALEALASVTGVDREVKRALPVIDDFAVTSAYSARTNRTEPQVVVGKRLSDRVRASATTGLTAESNFKTGVQWRLNNQTSVEAGYDNVQTTTSSQFGNVGVDLRWRLEFD